MLKKTNTFLCPLGSVALAACALFMLSGCGSEQDLAFDHVDHDATGMRESVLSNVPPQGSWGGPGDTVWKVNGSTTSSCENNPLLTFFPQLCDFMGECMTNVRIWGSVGEAIANMQMSILEAAVSESANMLTYALSYGHLGYPKNTCVVNAAPGNLMYTNSPPITPVLCMAINWTGSGINYADMQADVCSTEALYQAVVNP
ncbi:MAG: hypothetical protein QGI45_13875 [Myxococcota bacterium]|jgi:hypothetical protein|nr:hypothetical protein [Myxococcota bacterium]